MRALWMLTALALGAFLVAGCEGKVSNLNSATPGGRSIVYPISYEDADRVLSQSMVALFPGSPISAVALPNKGYTATLRILLDTHQITATAIPGVGQAPDGRRINGYSFEVGHSGTIPITGGNRASALFERINQQAAGIAAPLPAVSN